MVDKSPDSLINNLKKKNNPFKKILDNVKKYIKNDEEKDEKPSFEAPKKGKKEDVKKPSSLEASKKGKREEVKKSRSFEASKKGKREKRKRPSSFKESRNEKSPESNQKQETANIPIFGTSETKEAEKAMQESKSKSKEQKLPKKFRKGW